MGEASIAAGSRSGTMRRSMAGANPGNGADEQWLYRLGELVLGPVNRDQLVEKLFTGEINAHTEVSRLGQGVFQQVGTLDGFKLHIAKAEAKLRVEAKERSDLEAARKKKTVILAAVAGLAILIAVSAAVGARYLAIHNPWAKTDALADITMDPPTISLAHARAGDDELLDYPLEPTKSGSGHRERSERTTASRERGASGANKVVPAAGKPGPADSEGLEIGQADQSEIHEVVAAHQKSLYPCLVAEAQRKPGLSAKIPIEFAIGNDGHVTKLWIDNPDYKTGPLADCMLKELQKWPFKAYAGAGASVGLSFTIGKKGG